MIPKRALVEHWIDALNITDSSMLVRWFENERGREKQEVAKKR